MGILLAFFRMVALLLISVAVVLTHAFFRLFGRRWAFPKEIFLLACHLFGVRVNYVGTPLDGRKSPVMYLCNHVSYLDIIALGSKLDAVFVAKSEVASWPLFGMMTKMYNTVYITRTRAALGAAKNVVADLLEKGTSVIIFAEGTSTDGTSVKPFKPGLLDALYESGVKATVQPVAIVLDAINGQRVGGAGALRDIYAWWRLETEFAPHFWGFAQTRSTDITVHFLPVLDPAAYADRKELAKAAHGAVSAVVEAAAPLGYKTPDVPVAQPDRAPVS